MNKKGFNELWYVAKPNLVPKISDIEIEEMRHIQPLIRKHAEDYVFYRIERIDHLSTRTKSFIWDAKPTGKPLSFAPTDDIQILTFHTFGAPALFKPTLAEVYACIRRFVSDWQDVRYFYLHSHDMGVKHVLPSCHWCKCTLFGKTGREVLV